MSNSKHVPKKPSGGKPIPRRLFSFDSLKREKNLSNDSDKSSIRSIDTNRQILEGLPQSDDPFADTVSLTDKSVDLSGDPFRQLPAIVESDSSDLTPATAFRPTQLELTSLKADADLSINPPPSPSRLRWNTLRAHVIPSESTDDLPTAVTDLQPPVRPGSPIRPSTPRSYRFGQRKVFRQVVDQAREVAVDDSRRLSDAIQKASWAVRFGELPIQMRSGAASQGPLASTLHLPFMSSSASLAMVSSTSVSTIQATNKSGGLRRPPSVQSLSLVSQGMDHIARALVSSTTSIGRPITLPHELQVLSTLLVPFVGPCNVENISKEQETAVETFEFVIRTWKSPSSEVELERCIWCCKAASVPSASRIRVLGTLSGILFSRDKTFTPDTPPVLLTLLQSMFSLMYSLSLFSDAHSEFVSLKGFVSAVRSGTCGSLTWKAAAKEYGIRATKDEDEARVREAVVAESVVKCLQLGTKETRRWVLHNLIEEYWALPEPSLVLSPLLSCIHWRKLKTFVGSALTLVYSASTDASALNSDGEVVIRIFRTRILPEIDAIRQEDSTEIQRSVIRLLLELLCIRDSSEHEYVITHFCHWYQDVPAWKSSIERTIQCLIADEEWSTILRVLPALIKALPGEVSAMMVPQILPLLNDRLVADPPIAPCEPLSNFLDTLSRTYPKAFFKPLFTCAASTKDFTVATQLKILHSIATFCKDLWIRDAEMMTVILMSDTGVNSSSEGQGPNGSKVRIGQLALMLEIIAYLRMRDTKDTLTSASATRFFTILEARLGMLLAAKERMAFVSPAHRHLLCTMFREIRLMIRSLKPATWLTSVVFWTHRQLSKYETTDAGDNEENPDSSAVMLRLRAVYVQAQESLHVSNRSRTSFISPLGEGKTSLKGSSESRSVINTLTERVELCDALLHTLKSAALDLLVSVSGLLTTEDYSLLGPTLWSCVDNSKHEIIAPTCFLIMQCAEKVSAQFVQLIEDNLSSADPSTRRRAIIKFGVLSSWRFQILSQDVILDRTYRRPFKLARPPIVFVPTDMGTNAFVLEEDPDEFKDHSGRVLPLELRRRLSEIGWAQEDVFVNPKTEWIKTPISLLPSQQLHALGTDLDDQASYIDSRSPSPSPDVSPLKSPSGEMPLLRRNSSASSRSRGAKRRPVFVSTLVSFLPRLAAMALDDDLIIANTARSLVVDFMRDDPTLLARTVFNLLSADEHNVQLAVTILRTFLHIRHVLPPSISHHMLNHLTGFLKSSLRQSNTSTNLQGYACASPIIAKLVHQVSKMSVREIRRAKVDMLLLPSGALWFPPTAPVGPLFPRMMEQSQNLGETLPQDLVWITMIRTSQNMLFVDILRRNPQDFKIIRKNLSRLVLPSRDPINDYQASMIAHFIPKQQRTGHQQSSDPSLVALSLMLARSYILLTERILGSLSRHLNDRQELSTFMDGLNRILLVHSDDVGIVARVMLVYLIASTRFRRMFTSGGGYTMFMPAVIKAYAEAEHHPGIRAAIEYTVNRFYALHQESFIFQCFDIMGHIMMLPDLDGPWMAKNIYALFVTLSTGIPPSSPDAAGIHDMNQGQEKEAMLVTAAEELPQTFLASLRQGNGHDSVEVLMPLPEEYEGKHLKLDDFVRLFLTVIGHNPAILRAEQFLRFLQLLTPHLYHSSNSTRSVLREGIDALGVIFLTKPTGKVKFPEGPQIRPSENLNFELLSNDAVQDNPALSQSLSASDLLSMRLDYLSLVVAFTTAGGHLATSTYQRVVELVKIILKDSRASVERVSSFLANYMKSVLVRNPPPSLKQVVSLLSDLAPIVSAYCGSVDFTKVFNVVIILAENPIFADELAFARLVVNRYCSAGLDACELAASDNLLFSLPLRYSLIALLQSAVSLPGVDIFSEVEKRNRSHDYLAGVVLPFVLTLKTSGEIANESQRSDARRRDLHSRVWGRVISYILTTCQKMEGRKGQRKANSIPEEQRKSHDGGSSLSDSEPVMVFAIALQILKIVVIRAEEDISRTMPGVWLHLGTALKQLLSDGDAAFALRSWNQSEPSSPLASAGSGSFAEQQSNPFLNPSTSLHFRRLNQPRMIDYVTWSFIEWLCLRKTPLMLQMRSFIQEKTAIVHQELSQRSNGIMIGSQRTSRPVSAIFSKPRRSVLDATSSVVSTPRNSLYMKSSISLSAFDESNQGPPSPRRLGDRWDDGRLAGYARQPSPISPSRRSSQESTGPKIVHLGPVSPYHAYGSAQRPLSPGNGRQSSGMLSMAREVFVSSPILVRMTYRRIRVAQSMMGYGTLLPFGDGGELGLVGEDQQDPEVEIHAWTRAEALEAIVQETKELSEEFRESYSDIGEDSGVMVDSGGANQDDY